MKRLVVLLLAAAALSQAATTTYTETFKFAKDSSNSTADTRAGTWGQTDATTFTITFPAAPPGYTLHIVALSGSMTSLIHGLAPVGTHAITSFALQPANSRVGALSRATATNTQFDLGGTASPLSLDQALGADKSETSGAFYTPNLDMVLGLGNRLDGRIETYLNDTGMPIHAEVSLTITYTLEPSSVQPAPLPGTTRY